ncbi:MAG: TlpA family protein disulfide reductase [Chitinophagaceae bacterium]|nr:TlpA family protein disulfide reductase [Chitinophagaceae bacterium]
MKKWVSISLLLACTTNLAGQSRGRPVDSVINALIDNQLQLAKNQRDSFVGKNYRQADLLTTLLKLKGPDLGEKVFFLHFWFASCVPCIREFNGLEEMYKEYKDNKNFAFLSFTFENAATIADFKEKYHLTFPIQAVSENEINRLKLFPGYPVNILLGKGFIVEECYYGGMGSEQKSTMFIKDHISPLVNNLLQAKRIP